MPSQKKQTRVLASAEQQARWAAQAEAEGVSLSAWLAGLADAACDGRAAVKAEVQAVVSEARERGLPKASRSRRQMCEHRRAADQFCARCDG